MPVWRATDPTVDIEPKSGKQRRHIAIDCPLYEPLVKANTASTKGVPNTKKLQAVTVRCEHPDCWEARIKMDGHKQATRKAAGQPTGNLAKVSAAKAARSKPKAAAKPKQPVAA